MPISVALETLYPGEVALTPLLLLVVLKAHKHDHTLLLQLTISIHAHPFALAFAFSLAFALATGFFNTALDCLVRWRARRLQKDWLGWFSSTTRLPTCVRLHLSDKQGKQCADLNVTTQHILPQTAPLLSRKACRTAL